MVFFTHSCSLHPVCCQLSADEKLEGCVYADISSRWIFSRSHVMGRWRCHKWKTIVEGSRTQLTVSGEKETVSCKEAKCCLFMAKLKWLEVLRLDFCSAEMCLLLYRTSVIRFYFVHFCGGAFIVNFILTGLGVLETFLSQGLSSWWAEITPSHAEYYHPIASLYISSLLFYS